MSAIRDIDGGVILALRIVPRASRSEIVGRHGDSIKVRLQAPPVDGKANKALTRFLAKAFGVSPRAVTITSGDTSRNKQVRVDGVTRAAVEAHL